MGNKTCSRCLHPKPLAEFDPDKRKGGLRNMCRSCTEHKKRYYQEHRDQEIERAQKSLHTKGRTRINAYKRESHRKRPEVILLQNAKGRARRKGIPIDLTREDCLVPEKCPILGIPLQVGDRTAGPNSPSLDRIDPHGGYLRGNVRVISHRANTLKNDATPEELRRIAQFLEDHAKNSSAQEN